MQAHFACPGVCLMVNDSFGNLFNVARNELQATKNYNESEFMRKLFQSGPEGFFMLLQEPFSGEILRVFFLKIRQERP